MVYTGGTIVGVFALGFADLFGLVYDLDGGPLGDGTGGAIEGIGASAPGLLFAIGPSPVALCDGAAACGVIQGPAAAVIPEPGTWALLISGFGLVGAAARRRRPALA